MRVSDSFDTLLPSNVSRRGCCVSRSLTFFKNHIYIYEYLLSKRTHGEMEVLLSALVLANGSP